MSENCPLDEIDAYDRRSILWNGALDTDFCIAQCVIPSMMGSLVVSETHDLPDDFDPEHDDSSNHYGV